MDEEAPAAAPTADGLGFMVRALHHRSYRLFFIGQSVSLIGSPPWARGGASRWMP